MALTATVTAQKMTAYSTVQIKHTLKNVKVTVNTATGVASLWFDGTKVDDYTTENAANAVKFGFTRAGAAPNWAVPERYRQN